MAKTTKSAWDAWSALQIPEVNKQYHVKKKKQSKYKDKINLEKSF